MNRLIKLTIIAIGLSTVLCGCAKYELVGEVEATVTNKEHSESYTTMVPMTIPSGKTLTTVMRSQTHPEKYNVEVNYKDMHTTIDDKRLYKTVKIGDKLKVNHYISKDKKKEKIRYER